jgi:hypothetical protein
MAKRPVAAPKGKGKGKGKTKSGGGAGVNRTVILLLLAAIVPFSLPTVLVLSLTMLPTLAAYFTERGRHRYAWLCVGGLNFSGVVPFLFGLWFGVHNLDEAIRVVSDANTLFWAYGCSMIGWGLYRLTPPLVAGWISMSGRHRVSVLKSVQRRLLDDWGEDVGRKPHSGEEDRADAPANPV